MTGPGVRVEKPQFKSFGSKGYDVLKGCRCVAFHTSAGILQRFARDAHRFPILSKKGVGVRFVGL
jgi:hypothetical protein